MPTQSPSVDSPALAARGITVTYGAVHAVRGVDLRVEPGELVALLGPNGAGKSSVIGATLGLVKLDSGKVEIGGRTPDAAVRSGQVAVMLQSAGLPDGAKVSEVLRLFSVMYGRRRSVAELLKIAGLGDLANREVTTLSGGEAQRVRFAAVLAGRLRLMFLDEPTTGMDVESRAMFWQALREHVAGEGTGVLFATHYLEEADRFADRIVLLQAGRVVAEGTAGELKRRLGSGRVVELTADDPAAVAALPLPGRHELTIHGRTVRIRTSDADQTLWALQRSALPIHDVTVRGSDLDEVMLLLSRTEQEREGAD